MSTRELGTETTSGISDAARPRLVTGVRIRFDSARDQHVLLSPEAVLVLNPTAAEIVDLCDGRRTIADIHAELRTRYDEIDGDAVRGFVDELVARRGIEVVDE